MLDEEDKGGREGGGFLTGLILGAAVGAVVALLFAPASGEETRRLVRKRAKAIEKNVLIIPGNVFSDRDTHFRISYATTDENGKFELKGLPPGTYTIEAWHEKLGPMTQSVTLGSKESKDVNFTFKAPATATN